jgi:hypothetical protein
VLTLSQMLLSNPLERKRAGIPRRLSLDTRICSRRMNLPLLIPLGSGEAERGVGADAERKPLLDYPRSETSNATRRCPPVFLLRLSHRKRPPESKSLLFALGSLT